MQDHYNKKIEDLILENKKLHTLNNKLKDELNKANNKLTDCNNNFCKLKKEYDELNINYNKVKNLNSTLEIKLKRKFNNLKNEITNQIKCTGTTKKIQENDLKNQCETYKKKIFILCKILHNIYSKFDLYYEVLDILDDVSFFDYFKPEM